MNRTVKFHESEKKMSENNIVHTPDNFITEYNALVFEYAKLEERARATQIERIAIVQATKALNDRYGALWAAQRKNDFSPDFCHMVDMLGRSDCDLNGDVKALQLPYNPAK
jgi:hypothetical protein